MRELMLSRDLLPGSREDELRPGRDALERDLAASGVDALDGVLFVKDLSVA